MIASSNKSLYGLCVAGYLIFMTLTFDSSMVDALVFYVTDHNGTPVMKSGNVRVKPVMENNTPSRSLVAVQYKTDMTDDGNSGAVVPTAGSQPNAYVCTASEAFSAESEPGANPSHVCMIETPQSPSTFVAPTADDKAGEAADDDDADNEGEESDAANETPYRVEIASARPVPLPSIAAFRANPALQAVKPTAATVVELPSAAVRSVPGTVETGAGRESLVPAAPSSPKSLSILTLIKSLTDRPWEYDPGIDRYVVRYDSRTTMVLTIKPVLQRLVEKGFESYSCKLGAAIIQDPVTGAILALTSYDGRNTMSPDAQGFTSTNWALKATFPVASIFKIVTAAAGVEKGKVLPNSRVRFGKKASLELWEAFAKSHNGVFGVVGRAVGQRVLQFYANAFGFNKPFYFDLPVEQSTASMPDNSIKLGQAAAGLNKYFEVSPMHVSSIVSTVLNRGRWMKPYLVDYVLYDGKVIFRRKPFQLAQPISTSVAAQVYEMMKTTTTHGTGKRGFSGYADYPGLATMCGGKTGTLTGASPAYLCTWFGGFIKAGGRDLSIVTLIGQGSRVKATTVAGKIAHQLLSCNWQQAETVRQLAQK
jgi:hypothetical protein